MPLAPNRYTEELLEDFDGADSYCEAVETVLVKAGWHDDPVTGEAVLVESERIVRNQFGQITRRDVEEWIYEIAGGPPLEYTRDTYSAGIWIPGQGRSTGTDRVMESERIVYFPWSHFQPGSANLSRRRTLSGWVFYERRRSDDALSAEAQGKLSARGQEPTGPTDSVVDSARIWSEANHAGSVVEEEGAPQVAHWIDPIESEVELVFEEVDKFTLYTIRKNHLRPGDTTFEGPTHQKKELYQYRLGVNIDPPTIKARNAGDDGVRVEVTGGGASPPRGPYIRPEKYKVMRRTISEPGRTASGDPYGLYDTDPAAPTAQRLFITTTVTELDGTPSTALPSQTAYTEPGDTDPDDDYEMGWRVVAELTNEQGPRDEGAAVTTDGDVLSGAVYEYAAVALIGYDESPLSNIEQVTYGGADRSSAISSFARRRDDGGIDVDVLAPVDPNLPSEDYGETLVFDLPAEVYTLEEAELLGEELARRLFAEDQDAGLELELELTVPIVTLLRGQRVVTPEVTWTTTGNSLVMESTTVSKSWELDGFRLTARRSDDGSMDVPGCTLYLKEL